MLGLTKSIKGIPEPVKWATAFILIALYFAIENSPLPQNGWNALVLVFCLRYFLLGCALVWLCLFPEKSMEYLQKAIDKKDVDARQVLNRLASIGFVICTAASLLFLKINDPHLIQIWIAIFAWGSMIFNAAFLIFAPIISNKLDEIYELERKPYRSGAKGISTLVASVLRLIILETTRVFFGPGVWITCYILGNRILTIQAIMNLYAKIRN